MIAQQITAAIARLNPRKVDTRLSHLGEQRIGLLLRPKTVDQQGDLNPAIARLNQRIDHPPPRRVNAERIKTKLKRLPRTRNHIKQKRKPLRPAKNKLQLVAGDACLNRGVMGEHSHGSCIG